MQDVTTILHQTVNAFVRSDYDARSSIFRSMYSQAFAYTVVKEWSPQQPQVNHSIDAKFSNSLVRPVYVLRR
jgi:hypothetical protein